MKFKKIIFVSIFLLAVLTIGVVSAIDDNSTDIELESISENSDIEEIPLDASELLESCNEDTLETDSNNIQPIKESSDGFDVEFPKSKELYGNGEDDFVTLKITISKNAKGIISIYQDTDFCCNINLSGSNDDLEEYSIVNSGDKVIYNMNMFLIKAQPVNFTVKYDDGVNVVEKSSIVDITYILDCSSFFNYGETELRILAPHYGKGRMVVDIDGKKYEAYTKTIVADHSFTGYFIKVNTLSIGKHTMIISYLGDDNYPPRTVERQFEVVGGIYVPYSYNDGEKIILKLPSNAKGNLVVKVYNSNNKLLKTFTKKVVKGNAYVSFAEKNVYGKNYKIYAKYTGKDYDVKEVIMEDVDINPHISMPKKMLKGEKKYISIKLPGKKGVLKLYMFVKQKNGKYKLKVYSKKLVKGKAKISLSKFNPADEINYIKFIETLKSGKKVTYYYLSKQIKIVKPLQIISSKIQYGKDKVKIQAYKAGGKPLAKKIITIKINKKVIKKVKTNKKGIVEFKLPKKYKPNTYKLTAQYKKNIVSKKIKVIES